MNGLSLSNGLSDFLFFLAQYERLTKMKGNNESESHLSYAFCGFIPCYSFHFNHATSELGITQATRKPRKCYTVY